MRKSGFTEAQIIGMIKEQEVGMPTADPDKPQQNGFIESFNGSLRDEPLNEEIFDTLMMPDANWRSGDTTTITPLVHAAHTLPGNGQTAFIAGQTNTRRNALLWFARQTTAGNGRALEQFERSAHDALARADDEEYEIQTRRLSLCMREPRGPGQHQELLRLKESSAHLVGFMMRRVACDGAMTKSGVWSF